MGLLWPLAIQEIITAVQGETTTSDLESGAWMMGMVHLESILNAGSVMSAEGSDVG